VIAIGPSWCVCASLCRLLPTPTTIAPMPTIPTPAPTATTFLCPAFLLLSTSTCQFPHHFSSFAPQSFTVRSINPKVLSIPMIIHLFCSKCFLHLSTPWVPASFLVSLLLSLLLCFAPGVFASLLLSLLLWYRFVISVAPRLSLVDDGTTRVDSAFSLLICHRVALCDLGCVEAKPVFFAAAAAVHDAFVAFVLAFLETTMLAHDDVVAPLGSMRVVELALLMPHINVFQIMRDRSVFGAACLKHRRARVSNADFVHCDFWDNVVHSDFRIAHAGEQQTTNPGEISCASACWL